MERLIGLTKPELVGIIFTLIAYYMLSRIIKNHQDDGDSFSTFFLWAILDGICTITDFLKGGHSCLLSGVFTIGSGIIATQLFQQGKTKWQEDDTKVSFLVFISIIVWLILGPSAGAIAGTAGVLLAGIPQINESKKIIDKRKNIKYLVTWIFFLLGSIFFFFGEVTKDCESFIEERLYPSVDGIVSAFMVITYAMNLIKNKKSSKQLELFE